MSAHLFASLRQPARLAGALCIGCLHAGPTGHWEHSHLQTLAAPQCDIADNWGSWMNLRAFAVEDIQDWGLS
jgi:hypothetical protein